MRNVLPLSIILILASIVDFSVWPALNLPLPQLAFVAALATVLQPGLQPAALRLAVAWPVLGLALGWMHFWLATISVALTGLAALLSRRWLDLTNPVAVFATTFTFLIAYGGLALTLPGLWGQEAISSPGWLGLSWYATGAAVVALGFLWRQRRLRSS